MKKVNINNILHTVLISNENDTFYIVYNKFHREDNEPAIFMLGSCKIWMKNGLYHRENNKPAIDFDGLFIWAKNGIKYTLSFLSEEYYSLNSKDNVVLDLNNLQQALK